MATFTITTTQNIDALTGKAGGDIYNINGGTLTIDQDSRYGLNNTTSTTMGAITLSATLGGVLNIDGRYVRLIAYTGGTGNVPTLNTVITQGGASSKLIAVYSALTSAPIAVGAAMPASGFIKVKAWNSVSYSAGALTGIGATSSGVDIAGWIDVIGDEAGTITVPRLGAWNVTGEWYYLSNTTGANTGTYQLPTSGLTTYCPGVFVETAPSSDTYEFYPNAGTITAIVANFSSDWRSKVCWISTAGIVRFGSDGTNSLSGYIPETGCKVRLGNVFLQNATVAARTANVLPNATLATRYETLTTSSGVINIDKASIGWYLNCAQPYAVNINNTGVFDNITVSECASMITWNQVGVGQSAAVISYGLTMALNFAGGTLTDCTFTSISQAAAGRYIISLSDINGFMFTRMKTFGMTATRGNAITGSAAITRASNCTWNNCIIGSGRYYILTCTNTTYNNCTYFDNVTGNTIATNPMYAFDLASNCANTKIDGLNFGGLYMTQPYNGILNIGASGCVGTKLRNLGSYASPLSLGSPRRDDAAWTRVTTTATVTSTNHGFAVGDTFYVVVSSDIAAITVAAKTVLAVTNANVFTVTCLNAGTASGTICYFGTKCANVFVLAGSAAANDVKIQRVFAPHTRTNLFTADNSSKNITMENVFSNYLNTPAFALLNTYIRNVSGTPTLAVQTAIYGTHWFNGYTCDVANTTQNVSWTRVGTVVTVTAPGHSLRTTVASSSTVAGNIPISITASSDEVALPRGVQNIVTAVDSQTFKIVGVNAGALSGTLSYRVGNGRIGILMNESTVDTNTVYSFDSGNPNFTSAGTLFMPNIGDQVTFTTPIYIKGQGESFPIMELQIGGSTLTRYIFEYQIDKNDSNGFSAWHNLYRERTASSGVSGQYTITLANATGVEIGDYVWGTGVANKTSVTNINGNIITVDNPNIATVSGVLRFNHLPSESNLGPITGIKMKWRVTTVTANTVGINYIYVFTESTDTGRLATYPLDTINLTLTGIVPGSDIVILDTGTEIDRVNIDTNPTSSYTYIYESTGSIDIKVYKRGYVPFSILNFSLSSTDASVPVAQVVDRNYIE